MEWHIKCDAKDISRYIFCPGDQQRARKIADQFDSSHLVTESRGYIVFSGEYRGVFMTVCGTGMGGPAVAIGVEELAHMGGDTFIRVGSCGVFQEGQKPGDVIAASGTVRAGGTSMAYLPPIFPAVPTFSVLRALVEAGESLKIPVIQVMLQCQTKLQQILAKNQSESDQALQGRTNPKAARKMAGSL